MATSLQPSLQTYDYRIIESFNKQLYLSYGLTEKQGSLAIKIIKKYHKSLSSYTGHDILKFISNPVFKYSFRQPANIKKISITDIKHDGIVGKVIKVEFPYSEKYVELIRNKKPTLGVAVWNKQEKAWFFSLCEQNIKFLNYLVAIENFQADEEFHHYSNQLIKVVEELDRYVPMLVMENGSIRYRNVLKNVPQIKSTEILPALFEARRRGITTWDEEIGKFIENYENTVTSDFLLQDINESFYLDPKKYDISRLEDIVLNLLPCIFVIPGGSEFEKFKLAYDFVKKCKIPEKSISVLFRLSNDKGKNFNDYVRNCGLNNPLNENTKIVFVSGKIPKTLIKSKIHFNCIVNMGFDNPHYTSRYLVEKHQNLIYYSEKPAQQRFIWESLEL
jgi:hypothetical protein